MFWYLNFKIKKISNFIQQRHTFTMKDNQIRTRSQSKRKSSTLQKTPFTKRRRSPVCKESCCTRKEDVVDQPLEVRIPRESKDSGEYPYDSDSTILYYFDDPVVPNSGEEEKDETNAGAFSQNYNHVSVY